MQHSLRPINNRHLVRPVRIPFWCMSLTKGVIKSNIIENTGNAPHNDRRVQLHLVVPVANILKKWLTLGLLGRIPTWITVTVLLKTLHILHIINFLPPHILWSRHQVLKIIPFPELYLRLGSIMTHIIMPVQITVALRVLRQRHPCHINYMITHHNSSVQDLTTPVTHHRR